MEWDKVEEMGLWVWGMGEDEEKEEIDVYYVDKGVWDD